MIQLFRKFKVAITVFLISSGNVFAHHPNEGSLTLEQLLKEAELQNLEIKEAENKFKSSNLSVNSKKGPFLPQISIEGGPVSSKHGNESNSGTTAYGKLNWNLYRGGKDSSELEKENIKNNLDQKKVEAVKAKVIREISRVYFELLFLLESSDLKSKAIEMNHEQMKLGRLKNNSGFTSSADVIEFELRDATLNSDLKMIEQEISEKSREIAILIGRKDSTIQLVKGHLSRDTLMDLNRERILSQIRDSNIDLVEAQAEIHLSEKDEEISKSGFFPSVDLEASYGKLASEGRVLDGSNNYEVALKFSIPLFSGLETLNQKRAARFSVVEKEALSARKNLSAIAEVENLFSKLSTINERLNLEEKNLAKSEEYYKITLGEYRRGVKNSPDVVGASERLLDARIRNLEYRKDYYLTKLKIYELISSHQVL